MKRWPLLLLFLGACSESPSGPNPDGGGLPVDGAVADAGPAGLELRLSPAPAELVTDGITAAQVSFQAEAVYPDGRTADVTATANWTVEPAEP